MLPGLEEVQASGWAVSALQETSLTSDGQELQNWQLLGVCCHDTCWHSRHGRKVGRKHRALDMEGKDQSDTCSMGDCELHYFTVSIGGILTAWVLEQYLRAQESS